MFLKRYYLNIYKLKIVIFDENRILFIITIFFISYKNIKKKFKLIS